MTTIEELKFDDKNFNKHTEFGMSLLEKSLRQNGAGRSILVDKDNNIIAGNGIVEAAVNAGITKTRVIEVTGDELVVVKRTDIELNTKQGREMALADNATAAVDLCWDNDVIKEMADEFDIKTEEWGVFKETDINEDDFFETLDNPEQKEQKDKIVVEIPQGMSSEKEEIVLAIKAAILPYNGVVIK